MMRVAAALLSLMALAGCDLFNDEDPRVGSEAEASCKSRVEARLRLDLSELGAEPSDVFVPTYTYDITKLSLEAIQGLSQSDSDEIKGTRLNQATNETATAVDQFMRQSVDEDGAFFLGRDPALYRVRGEAQPFADIIAAGCDKQQPNMRLIDIDFSKQSAGPTDADEPDDTSPEETNS